jgi:hypothetical protein
MTSLYYQTINKLEQDNVSKEYILGWASGYLGNPKVEQQRITEGYEAGYNDGKTGTTESASGYSS